MAGSSPFAQRSGAKGGREVSEATFAGGSYLRSTNHRHSGEGRNPRMDGRNGGTLPFLCNAANIAGGG